MNVQVISAKLHSRLDAAIEAADQAIRRLSAPADAQGRIEMAGLRLLALRHAGRYEEFEASGGVAAPNPVAQTLRGSNHQPLVAGMVNRRAPTGHGGQCGRDACSRRNHKWGIVVGTLSRVVLISAAFCASSALAQPPPWRAICTGVGCGAVADANQAIAIFSKYANATGLRADMREVDAILVLAYTGIDGANRDFARGRLTESERDRIVATFREQILRFLDQMGSEAASLATHGRYSDLPAINFVLGNILPQAKSPDSVVADRAIRRVVQIFTLFSTQFAATCEGQAVPVVFVLGLEQQNAMAGTEVSVFECAKRRYSTDISSQGVNYHFETCTYNENAEWKLRITGKVTGQGAATAGGWNGTATYQGRDYEPSGDFEIIAETIIVMEPPIPPDAGTSGGSRAAVPRSLWMPTVQHIRKIRITTIGLTGDHGINAWTNLGRWAAGDVVISEGACDVREQGR